ncbi:MAG: rod shape-determining protein [bacterium]|nr:rod shape-determining protein [bacterium]
MSSNVYGIDLGTCNLKVYSKANSRIFNEKNTVAIVNKNQLYAYGDSAFAMYEKAPETINVTFPMEHGVIAEYAFLQAMVFEFLEKHAHGKVRGADFIVAVPTDVTEVEKKAFFDMFYKSKMKPKLVQVCEKPIADAIGLGIDVTEPTGVMVVDIGADTTEISVISLGGLVLSSLLHFGGNQLDESIAAYFRKNSNLLIGKKTACAAKEAIGCALLGEEESMTIVGRDVVSGLPIEATCTSTMVYEAMQTDLNDICNSIKMTLEHTPPELARDIIHSGIYITGGSSKIRGLDELFTKITGITVNTCEDPEESVTRGLMKLIGDSKFRHLAYTMKAKIYK